MHLCNKAATVWLCPFIQWQEALTIASLNDPKSEPDFVAVRPSHAPVVATVQYPDAEHNVLRDPECGCQELLRHLAHPAADLQCCACRALTHTSMLRSVSVAGARC